MSIQALNSIRMEFQAFVRERCEEAGCVCRCDGLPEHVILNGDQLQPDRPMPDGVFFISVSGVSVALVELKGRNADVSVVVRKLRNGGVTALEILKRVGYQARPSSMLYVLLTKAWRSSSEFIVMTRSKVEVAGRRYDIIAKRCGHALSDILENRG
jgi:hypothetical protein